MKRFLWAERALLVVVFPASLLFTLVLSPAWPVAPDPTMLLPEDVAARLGNVKLLAYGGLIAGVCALGAFGARHPIVPLGLLAAVVLSLAEIEAATASWPAIFGQDASPTGGPVLLVGLAPVAILLAAFALRAQRSLHERILAKRLAGEATRAALAPGARLALLALGAGCATGLALALALPFARAPEAAAAARPVGLLVGALLLVAAFGLGAGWFHRKPLAGETGAEERAAIVAPEPPSP